MSPTRREFMRIVGLASGALLSGRCASFSSTPALTSTPTPDSPRGRLRACWQRLDWLQQQFKEDSGQGQQAQYELLTEHRAVLDELVAFGEMDPTVSIRVQIAFDAAVRYHSYYDAIETLGYEIKATRVIESDETSTPAPLLTPVPVEIAAGQKLSQYISDSEVRLMCQIDLLSEMAGQSDLNPDTVVRVQTVIQRDLTLVTSYQMKLSLREQMVQAAVDTGDTYSFPLLDELDVEISPEAAAATRFLVELLLEEKQ